MDFEVESVHPEEVSTYDFLFESQVSTLIDLKDLIYSEILLYHFSDKLEEYHKKKQGFKQILEENHS